MRINIHNWVIVAVCEHIIAEGALAGGNEGVGVEEAAPGGVVITGLQVVEICFDIVNIATVAQGIPFSQKIRNPRYICVASCGGITPGIVGVADQSGPGAVPDRDDITLQIGYIEIGSTVVDQRQRCTVGISGDGRVRPL